MTNDLALIPLEESELRGRRSLKWSRTDPGVVPADIAEADFVIAEPIREVLVAAAVHSDLGYPDFDSAQGGPRRLAELFADRMRSKFDIPADPDRVEVCAQIMQALCCVILVFSEPGDHILVHEPSYPPILRAIENLGRRPLAVPVSANDSVEIMDAASSMRAGRIAVVVLCNPHNPTGRIFGADQLTAIATIADMHNSVIFADEVYQDMTYETPHRSIAAIDLDVGHRTIMFTSAAKSFNIPGLRCAVGHFGSSALQRRFRDLPWHLRSGAGILGIEATIVAWQVCEAWLEAFRYQLRRNRNLVSRAMLASACGYIPPEATYFAWIDLRGTVAHSDPLAYLKEKQKVILQDGTVFGKDYSGFVRFNFAVSERRLTDLLCRVVQVASPRGDAISYSCTQMSGGIGR